jgi:hypothetical protein
MYFLIRPCVCCTVLIENRTRFTTSRPLSLRSYGDGKASKKLFCCKWPNIQIYKVLTFFFRISNFFVLSISAKKRHNLSKCASGPIFTKLRRRKHKRRVFVCFKIGQSALRDSTYWWRTAITGEYHRTLKCKQGLDLRLRSCLRTLVNMGPGRSTSKFLLY